jgi:hypothetical protein
MSENMLTLFAFCDCDFGFGIQRDLSLNNEMDFWGNSQILRKSFGVLDLEIENGKCRPRISLQHRSSDLDSYFSSEFLLCRILHSSLRESEILRTRSEKALKSIVPDFKVAKDQSAAFFGNARTQPEHFRAFDMLQKWAEIEFRLDNLGLDSNAIEESGGGVPG